MPLAALLLYIWLLIFMPSQRPGNRQGGSGEKHPQPGSVSELARGVSEGTKVAKQAIASVSEGESCVAKLAQFFPHATAVRIPVRVTRLRARASAPAENTVIEFGTFREVIFSSGQELEFEDRIRVQNSDGSLNAEAEIVAMQLHDGKTAVAARFLNNVTNWIIKK